MVFVVFQLLVMRTFQNEAAKEKNKDSRMQKIYFKIINGSYTSVLNRDVFGKGTQQTG